MRIILFAMLIIGRERYVERDANGFRNRNATYDCRVTLTNTDHCHSSLRIEVLMSCVYCPRAGLQEIHKRRKR